MKNEERYKKLSVNVFYWRKKRGLTQKELAEKAGVSVYVLRSIERPDTKGSVSIINLFKSFSIRQFQNGIKHRKLFLLNRGNFCVCCQ